MRIVWSNFAKNELSKLFQYVENETNSNIAEKFVTQIIEATERLESFPEMGQRESEKFTGSFNYRYMVEGHYKIVYEIIKNDIVIHDVFDTRQSPDKLLKAR